MPYQSISLNWLFNYEDRFEFPEGYNLSRLLPTFGDYQEFKDSMISYIGQPAFVFLSFIERYQLFIDWLIDRENGFLGCRVYNIRHSGTIDPHLPLFDFPKAKNNIRHYSGLPEYLPLFIELNRKKSINPNRRFSSR